MIKTKNIKSDPTTELLYHSNEVLDLEIYSPESFERALNLMIPARKSGAVLYLLNLTVSTLSDSFMHS